MMYIAIKRGDGGVSIMQVAEGADVAECIAKWAQSHAAGYAGHESVRAEDVPADETFRNAWKLDGGIKVDMDKAREIHMSRIRAARDEALAALDIEQLKGNDVQAQKQALRDIPRKFDLTVAQTPEELKALWPDELK